MNKTAKDITTALLKAYVQISKYCVPNVYFYHLMGEDDLLIVKESGYISSVEVKVSRADFKADFKKIDRHHIMKTGFFQSGNKAERPNRFYYAVPENLIKVEEIPDYAGLLYITASGDIKKIKEAPLLHKEKIEVEKRLCNKFYYSFLELRSYKENLKIKQLEKTIRDQAKELEESRQEKINLRNNVIMLTRELRDYERGTR